MAQHFRGVGVAENFGVALVAADDLALQDEDDAHACGVQNHLLFPQCQPELRQGAQVC